MLSSTAALLDELFEHPAQSFPFVLTERTIEFFPAQYQYQYVVRSLRDLLTACRQLEILSLMLQTWESNMTYPARWLIIIVSLLAVAPAWAQSTEGDPSGNAAGILNSLPPDLYKKLQQLSQLIDRNIKAGTLTEAQVQRELMSGRLDQTIRSLGPEANQLFEEITADMKNDKGPGEDALVPLLGGLGGMGK